jgi:hypothetical protein
MRDGTEVADPRLGRLVQFDARSRGFPVRAVLPTTWQHERSRMWYLPSTAPVLDQGREGSCVGHGITNELRFTPVPAVGLDSRFAVEQIYWPAQRIDEWDGGSYPGADPFYEGTSVLAGIKAAVALGYYREYRWCFGEKDLALAVGYLGPVVIGVNWHENMTFTDEEGYIHPTGPVLGGHCVVVVGFSRARGDYTIMNSWGPSYGVRGRCRIGRADLASLLAADGEACIPVGRVRPKVAR